jgi:predicted lipoprotein with Yx(FWY)xxD motif
MKRFTLALAAAALAFSTAAFSTAALAEPPAGTGDTSLGKVWVDANGMTLYTFTKDEPGVTNCYEQCAVNWPPFMAAEGAMAEGDWTVVERTDGTSMWAYKGWPLYTWIGDQAPGDVTGEGVGGVWHVAKAE